MVFYFIWPGMQCYDESLERLSSAPTKAQYDMGDGNLKPSSRLLNPSFSLVDLSAQGWFNASLTRNDEKITIGFLRRSPIQHPTARLSTRTVLHYSFITLTRLGKLLLSDFYVCRLNITKKMGFGLHFALMRSVPIYFLVHLLLGSLWTEYTYFTIIFQIQATISPICLTIVPERKNYDIYRFSGQEG
jgi:hypothetical protein